MSKPSTSPLNGSDIGNMQREWCAIHRALRVLLAEDNKINQQFAVLVLTKVGHSVEIVSNGAQAIAALRRSDFDVVLMDIQMPELDGVQATRQIRTLPEPKGNIPIIAVSAYAEAGAREKYVAAGMNDFITKPFQPAELLSTLERISSHGSAPAPVPALEYHGAQTGIEPVDDLPILDLEQLTMIGSVFSPMKIRTLTSLYLLDVEARLVLIAAHRDMNDYDGISRQAHMIVSSAGTLGAKQTSALARVLETSCIKKDNALSDRLIGELRTSCRLSSTALKHWRNEEVSSDAVMKG